ncbi:hypothetical protein [Abyssalbus ytuae]|uniref:Uncharacterized protein n=1 Tax=Abyssalbus ytuae TaxID=2926907 RepID=A0A9E6ZWW2_9FLAO|nr:hypothetical protein [Abyssalbus ytuae]UOB18286.1 hypothetical protein MQE35_03105 [Abyssalbus ytuae]
MKKVVTLIILLTFLSSYAQKSDKIKFDYTATFVVKSKKNGYDTLNISVGQNGKYLYSEIPSLGKSFLKQVFKGRAQDNMESSPKFLLNTSTGRVIVSIQTGVSNFYMDLNIKDFAPGSPFGKENMNLLSEQTDKKINVLGEDVYLYRIFPEANQDDILLVGLSKKTDFQTTKHIGGFFKFLLDQSKSNTEFSINIPDGLVIYVESKGEEKMRCINIDHTKKTVSFNFNFNVE